MMPKKNKITRAHELDGLSKPARVAVCCAALEHTVDIYRSGSHVFQVKHVRPGALSDPPDRDLVEVGLQHAWRFALEGQADAKVEQAMIAAFHSVPPGQDPEELKGSGDQVAYGVAKTLLAISDPTPQASDEALLLAYYAVFGMSECVEALEGREREAATAELEWQNRLLADLSALGTAPLNRAWFAPFIAEQLPWRKHLQEYREGCRPAKPTG